MSDVGDFNPDDYTMDPTGNLREKEQPVSRKWIRDLEKRAKKGDEALAETAQLRRELAVMRAGVPLDSPIGKLFIKAYDGPDDPDAIKAAAVEYGVLQPSSGEQAQIDESLRGHEAAGALASGAATQNTGVNIQAEMQRIVNKHPVTGLRNAASELDQFLREHNITPDQLKDFPGYRR